jgi:hypothetical protein
MTRAAQTLPSAARLRLRLVGQLKSSSNWLYAITILSFVNAAFDFTGSRWTFMVGLGITQIVSAVARYIGPTGEIVGFVTVAAVASLFSVLGLLARRGHGWALVVGMLLYALDGLLFLLARDWLSLAFHAYAVFSMYRGLRALSGLRTLSRAQAIDPGRFAFDA